MKILYCSDFRPAREALKSILPEDEILFCEEEDIINSLEGVDVIIPFHSKIDETIIEKGSFKLVQQSGVGIDKVDISAATRKGVYVANVPSKGTGNDEAVAELAILLMLALARKFPEAQQNFHNCILGLPVGMALNSKAVGIIGLGGIGQELIRRLRGFGVSLMGMSRSATPQMGEELGLDFCTNRSGFYELLERSDFLVICCSLNKESRDMINKEAFKRLKKGAYIINVSRGPIIDRDALLWALETDRISGAGLDVYWKEPPDTEDPIFRYNVIATPHIGGCTDVALMGMARGVAENINRVRLGKPPLNCFNLEELKQKKGNPPSL